MEQLSKIMHNKKVLSGVCVSLGKVLFPSWFAAAVASPLPRYHLLDVISCAFCGINESCVLVYVEVSLIMVVFCMCFSEYIVQFVSCYSDWEEMIEVDNRLCSCFWAAAVMQMVSFFEEATGDAASFVAGLSGQPCGIK